MKTRTHLLFVAAFATAPVVGAACSGKLAAGMMRVHMTEFSNNGEPVVRESGWLPGIEAGVAKKFNKAHLFATGKLYSGHIHYDGRIQSGQPFKSRTGTRLTQLRVGAGYNVRTDSVIGGAIESDRWAREIEGSNAVLGLRERTRSLRLTIDGSHSWATQSGEVSVSASIYRAGAERLNVTAPGAIFDSISLKTRPATGHRAALGWRPKSIRNTELMFSYDSIRIGRSLPIPITRGGVPAGFLQQPEHFRRNAAMTIAYYF